MLKTRLFAVSLLALIFIAGCSSQSTAVTPTKTLLPTNTPMPTPTPTIAPYQVAAGCGATFASTNFGAKATFGQIGDLIFTRPELAFLSYPGIKLSDNIPQNKPFQVDTQPESPFHANPGFGNGVNGLRFTICNSSTSVSHTLQTLYISISAFTPDTSTNINVEVGCDSPFNSHTRSAGGGCGGSLGPCNDCYFFHATWPATIAANTQGNMQEVDSDNAPVKPSTSASLPVSLKAGATITLWVGADYPTVPGTFTFDFGAKVDTGTMTLVNYPSEPLFLAKNAHHWSGYACLQSATMNALIPATGIDHDFVCPQTS